MDSVSKLYHQILFICSGLALSMCIYNKYPFQPFKAGSPEAQRSRIQMKREAQGALEVKVKLI